MTTADKKGNTGKGFDRLAPFYDLMLKITSGNSILKSQAHLLSALPPLNKVLIIGGGTGSFLIELLKQKDVHSITYVDISEGMILQTRKMVQKKAPAHFARIQFICGTVDTIPSGEFFDAVFTNYFLDLFEPEELKRELIKIYSLLKPYGYWHVTDFSYPQAIAGPRRLVYKCIHHLLYFFFKTLCGISGKRMPDLKTALEALRLKILEEKYFLNRFLWSGIYQKSQLSGN